MIFEENLQYEKPLASSFGELHLEIQTILNWVGQDKQMLEIACHTGHLSEWAQKQNNEVVGVEINSKALEYAKPFLKKAIVGDVENVDLWDSMNQEEFDIITFIHVLEHLVDPWKVLTNSKKYLKSGGKIIIGLPNVNNADTRFDILFGKFEYEETGVMDRTHLRFFNPKTATEMIQSCGLEVIEYFSPWQINPIPEFLDHFPILHKTKKLFSKKPPSFPKFPASLTDVTMLFLCKVSS